MFSFGKKLYVVMLIVVFTLIVVSPAQAILYTPWYDVNKYWGPTPEPLDPDPSDSMMCWAATASNVLMYTDWGVDRDGDGTVELYDDIYHEFLAWFPNVGGGGEMAYQHYIDTFWSGVNYNDYFRQELTYANILPSLDAWLADDFGIYLSITNDAGTLGHAITCWGYETDASGNYTQIYVTDSDDDFPNSAGPPVLQTYDVSLHANNRWYIDDYGTDVYIRRIDAFGRNPIPEPSTLILLGIGLIGLRAIWTKKVKKG